MPCFYERPSKHLNRSVKSYLDHIFAELSPATFLCWLQWPALTRPMWPRSCYETVMPLRSQASELSAETSRTWMVPLFGPKNNRPCSAADSPRHLDMVSQSRVPEAERHLCSEPEQCTSLRTTASTSPHHHCCSNLLQC